MNESIVHSYSHPDWEREIREREGRRCVKCNYHHASPKAIAGGHMLCTSCTEEWEGLHRGGRSPVTEAEWLKLPSLIQFIQEYRKTH